MKIQQLRNATIIVEFGQHRVLVDPMLARQGALPPLRLFGARQRNPLVELPVLPVAASAAFSSSFAAFCILLIAPSDLGFRDSSCSLTRRAASGS